MLGGIPLGVVALGAGVVVMRSFATPEEPEVTLWSTEDQPLRSTAVNIRCGGEVHRVVSNARGGIYLPPSCHEAPSIDGFDLLRTEQVNREAKFHFSPLGTIRFELYDLKGARLFEVPTTITVHYGKEGVMAAETVNGQAEFFKVPLALPTKLIQVLPDVRRWQFADMKARRVSDGLVYSVRLQYHSRPSTSEAPLDGVLTSGPFANYSPLSAS